MTGPRWVPRRSPCPWSCRCQERAAIVDAAATFTDDQSGAPTWIQVHVSGHLGWPAGVGYCVVALTPPDAVQYGINVHVDSLIKL
jgi:hypothetical protein